MASAMQFFARVALSLCLYAACYLLARYGEPQGGGLFILEVVGLGAVLLGLTAWSWIQPNPANSATEFASFIFRKAWTVFGLVVSTGLCVAAFSLGALSHYAHR